MTTTMSIFYLIESKSYELKNINETDKMFNRYTNYPCEVILKEGSQIMFLNNRYFSKEIYNGSIGIILRILNESLIKIVFPILTEMVIIKVKKIFLIL